MSLMLTHSETTFKMHIVPGATVASTGRVAEQALSR
jgi:hypothetical protein